jgi:biuret amidohydrolase
MQPIDRARTALLVIDFQRDFLEPGGFGTALGNDVSRLARAVYPTQRVLAAARAEGMLVVHTREGHRPDLSDCPPSKRARGRIGEPGPMGRILVRGEAGHDLVPDLAPVAGEPVVDKPGKGAFFATDLDAILRARGIETLLVTGVTTEVCVQSTVREASDRGYRVIVLGDCCASYFPAFHEAALAMVAAQGGIFGEVATSRDVIRALGERGDGPFPLFVNGTLMRGLKLHGNLEGADFLGAFRTAPHYRVHTIGDVHPGMYRVASGGASIAGELYLVPASVWRAVDEGEPPNLYKGPVELEDGRVVDGILFPRELAEGVHREITEFGDWRAYWATCATPRPQP